jgi:hypothetical protein
MTPEGSIRGWSSSSGNPTRESPGEELWSLSVADLLARAEAAGIHLIAEGDQLRVRGPRNAEALGRLLLERKPEVMAVICSRSRPAAVPQSARSKSDESEEPLDWDAESAAAVVAEVDARIDTALSARGIVGNSARGNVLANERAIVRRLARKYNPSLWAWPQALERLLARWEEWDGVRNI